MEFRPLKAGHFRYIRPQPEQEAHYDMIINSSLAEMYEEGMAFSGWDGNRCVGAAGAIPVTAHRAVGWFLLSRDAGPHMRTIIRKTKELIKLAPYRRVEICVDVNFQNGHRLAKALGMVLETPEPLKAFGPQGEDEMMYASVRDV